MRNSVTHFSDPVVPVLRQLFFFALISMGLSAFSLADTASTDQKKTTDTKPAKKEDWFDSILDSIGADDKFDPSKGMNFVFLPGPFFSPDAEFGVGLSSVGLYRIDPNDTKTQLSTLTIDAFLTTNKSLGVSIDNKTFFTGDKQRLYITADIQDSPQYYYGIGYESGIQSSNRQRYTEREYEVSVQWLFRVLPSTYLGWGAIYDQVRARNERPSSPPPPNVETFPSNNRSVGLTATAVLDSRDVIINPEKGRLVQGTVNYYNSAFTSQTDFSTYLLDYREYMSLSPAPGLLAFQFKANFSAGNIPWSQLTTLGGDDGLRGYLVGRYRAQQTLLSQLEYRVPIAGRHGMVTWIGGAAMADRIRNLTVRQMIPNIGVGYRLRLKGRVNLRLDWGFGRNGGGFYFNVNEAF